MTTLFDATLRTAQKLNSVYKGTATGGSTTTLVDTGIFDPPGDTWYPGGTIWFQSGNNDGVSKVVTDWDQSTKTFTFGTAAAVVAGVTYSVADKTFPRHVLIQAVNAALYDMRLPKVYENASFVTVANQQAYTLPTGVDDLKQVFIASYQASPYYYFPSAGWRVLDGELVFDTGWIPELDDYRIKLVYYTNVETALTADDDTIDAALNLEGIAWNAAVNALRWRYQRVKDNEPTLTVFLQEAIARAEGQARKYRVKHINRSPRHPGW